jgi:hypothetical protein
MHANKTYFFYIYIYIYIDGRIILRWIFRKLEGVVELPQDRDRWRALVGTVRDFRVP